jgi:hypothetical protein
MEREREMLPEICLANELSVNTGHSDKYTLLENIILQTNISNRWRSPEDS